MHEAGFCTRCGTARPADAAYCATCGAPLPAEAAPSAAKLSPELAGPPAAEPPTPADASPSLDETPAQRGGLDQPQWSLVCAIGMVVGVVLPWAQTNGLVGISVSALAGFGRDLT